MNSHYSLSTLPFDNHELKAVIDTFKSGRISQGPKVKKFENEFAKKMGTKYGVAVNSGSSANLIILEALKSLYNLKNGDEVIIPASTFATVAMPIIQVGLTPVFVDIDKNSLNMDPKELEKGINKKTKIIMTVHTLGNCQNIDEIQKIAKKNKVLLFEDCCEAHGSSIKNKKVGSWGIVSAFSFFVAHNMTTGEGGMILTSNKKIMQLCKSLREFGRVEQNFNLKDRYYTDKHIQNYDKRYLFSNIGFNVRMSDISAAIGLVQLKKLEKNNKRRIENAKYLYKKLNKYNNHKILLPSMNFDGSNVFYTFPIILLSNKTHIFRKKLCIYLESKGIETRPMMAGCLPDQPAFSNKKNKIIGNLKNSRFIRDNLFFIGIHPNLNVSNMNYFLKHFEFFLNKYFV